jgi:hypothetical protein
MKTALILTAAVAVVYFCEADTVKAKGPHGSHGVSSNSSSRYVKTTNYPTYTNQVFAQKPIVVTSPTLVQKTVILPLKTIGPKHHLHYKHHRHRGHGIDVPDVEIGELDVNDDDADDNCELADGVSDSRSTPTIAAGTPADDDADDDDD